MLVFSRIVMNLDVRTLMFEKIKILYFCKGQKYEFTFVQQKHDIDAQYTTPWI